MDRDLKELQDALRRGEAKQVDKAFSSIYEEYRLLVKAVLGRYLANPSDVEELSQEVFAAFYAHAGEVNGSLKGYLARSSMNKALDLLRKRGREEELEKEEGIPEEALNPRAIAFERWASGILGESDWNLVYLHLLAGYSFEEIAFREASSPGACKSRYYRALRKLRKEGKAR